MSHGPAVPRARAPEDPEDPDGPDGPDGPGMLRLVRSSVRSPNLGVAAVTIGLMLLHVWWLVHIRSGGPFEWDEAGYLQIALRDLRGFRDAGLTGLAQAFVGQAPGAGAPLVPLAAALPIALAGGSPYAAWTVQVASVALLVAVTYGIGRRLVPARHALLSAVVIGTLPLVTDYARVFHFAVPATALLAAATWALLRSDGLQQLRWAAATGVLLGLMVLSRTMTVAYLPGIGASALLLAALRPGNRRRRLSGWVLLVTCTVLTAATWYLRNARSVAQHLLSAGYGASAAEYGTPASVLSVGFWTRGLAQLITDLRLPLTIVVLVILLLGFISYRLHERDTRGLRSWLTDDRSVLAIIVLEGYLAVTSTTNTGTGFALPWTPHLLLLCTALLARINPPLVRRTLVFLLLLVSTGNLLVQSALVTGARPMTVALPGVGDVSVVEPRSVIHHELVGAFPDADTGGRLPAAAVETRRFTSEVADAILELADRDDLEPRVLDAAGDWLLNSTRYSLEAILRHDRTLVAETFQPREGGLTVASDAALISAWDVPFVITGEPLGRPSFGIDRVREEAAVRLAGYEVARRFTTWDGRTFLLWQRRT